ncbi:hypothetical protein N7457_009135 [Penicillium paradoxum]|uniref:uncharacterized protein n=1 Tax=Penicillium paradoxum TaxID=176176 RepID=UPI0025491831|nr:uncharacterized protein N7457_009135 [Penicillium paradoxum]KAJ5774239.1 hypothetical protein N7457_009135 [Penicillium paradoxum]
MQRQRLTKRPKLRWDTSMRQTLCCLYRFFQCGKRQKEEIFFAIFRENLRRRDIRTFVPFGTLHTQWSWMRNTGDLVWARVHKDTEFDVDGEWKNIIQRIKSTAVTLRLSLHEKTEDDIDTTLWGTRVIASGPRRLSSASSIVLTTVHKNVPSTRTLLPTSSPETPRRMPFPPYSPEEQQERSRYFVGSDNRSGGSSTVDDRDNHEQTHHLSVVTSHGKICLWCEYGTTIDEPDSYDDQSRHSQYERDGNNDQSQEPRDQHQERQDLDQEQHDEAQQSPHRTGHSYDHEQAMQGVSADMMPPLLYRWSNCDSQGINSKTCFRAALFCNGEWFNPEDFSETRFLNFFRSHVTKQKTKTPFISTFLSPLAPIHRALASQKGAIVTVIDTSKLNTKVFYACPLAVRTRSLVHMWKGYGEYLIWGHIPTEAIVSTLEIARLEEIANSHRDINRLMQISLISSLKYCDNHLRDMLASKTKSPFKSGRTLGKLLTLLQVPMVHWDNIAPRFAKTWGWKSKKEVVQFCNGVKSPQPYLSEELSDSESEVILPTPQQTPGNPSSKEICSFDSLSDLDYEPPETDEDTEGTSDTDGPTDSRSISMYDKTETADDGNFSTHETLSSGLCPADYGLDHSSKRLRTEEVVDLTSDNEDTCSQRALKRDWPSDDEIYPDTPTPIEVRVPRSSEGRLSPRFDFRGQMNMNLAERMQLWSPHEN